MTDRSHDALSGPRAAHEDVAIVGVTNEPMTPPLQFPVQLIEHDVGQQRRQGSLNAKDNFQFERTIVGFRGRNVVDLRRKQ
jgi:hypothetical protein